MYSDTLHQRYNYIAC